MNKFLILILIFTTGWTDVAKINDWLPIYQYWIIILILLNLFNPVLKLYWNKEDYFLSISLFILIISSLINFNSKTINYVLAYSYVFIIVYFFIKSIFLNYSEHIKYFMRMNMYAIIFLCFYSVIEFIAEFLFALDTSKFIFKSKEATATYLPGISRSYGFSTEPTTFALYLNILGPLAILKIKEYYSSISIKFFLYTLIFFGWFFTFSAAGFLFLFLSIFLSIILTKQVSNIINVKNIFISLSIIILVFNFLSIDFSFFDKILGKITLSGTGTSVSQRFDVYNTAIERFTQNPFLGSGLGFTSSLNEMSSINWYLTILTNGGILALTFILLFFFFKFLRIDFIDHEYKLFFYISFFSAVFGLAATSTFYNPFIWILFCFIEIFAIKKVNLSYD